VKELAEFVYVVVYWRLLFCTRLWLSLSFHKPTVVNVAGKVEF
jgi:hypothetical protein